MPPRVGVPPPPSPAPGLLCTQPWWTSQQVLGSCGGSFPTFLRAGSGRAPGPKAQPPGARWWAEPHQSPKAWLQGGALVSLFWVKYPDALVVDPSRFLKGGSDWLSILGFRRNSVSSILVLEQWTRSSSLLSGYGFIGVCFSGLHVFCGSGEGLWPRSSRRYVGGAMEVWGVWVAFKGYPVPV